MASWQLDRRRGVGLFSEDVCLIAQGMCLPDKCTKLAVILGKF
jgi:hypothetical protein